MSKFGEARRRLAQHRICLEKAVAGGIVSAAAYPAIDACYTSLSSILDSARVELEAAGPDRCDHDFVGLFVGGCANLGKRMHRATTAATDEADLLRTAVQVRAGARALMEHLWARLERVAA